ncbi:flavin reductase family protein [Massilia sp. LjRoot122]|uniref:flavin reductase family protein n=1 Tax=Massilia sp. LjRoot122 TaxID=3342257 RepID=UPI003ECCC17D
MARVYKKLDFPTEKIRRYLEPGPIVLVSSSWEGQRNIMTMGWHTVMDFSPALVGCVIASSNHSFELLRKSRECVINLPTTALLDAVVGIGTTSGSEIDKFERFALTPESVEGVDAPAIRECHAHFVCRLHDDSLVDKYNFFIWEVVAARVARTPKHPETVHYTGEGLFMVAGKVVSRRSAGLLAMEPS